MFKGHVKKFKELVCKIKSLKSDWNFLKIFTNDKRDEKEEVLFSLLRRNCHALDKGLHTIPFEKGHGKSIYAEAITFKKQLKDSLYVNDPAYLWCEAIIAAYEQAQSQNLGELDRPYRIYTEDEKHMIYNFFHSRISCRNFNNKKVKDSIWNEIIAVAADAPNGCCRQTSRIYVVSNKEIITKLKINIAGATGFSNGIPYLLCITADTRPYTCVDRMLAYIDASLFTENLVLGCRANNIFTTILNFQHASERERESVSECLGIPSHERIILFIAAGYVDSVPEKPIRMSVERFRKM